MLKRHYPDLLNEGFSQGRMLCVGLDPVWEKLPAHLKTEEFSPALAAQHFCAAIVDATQHVALAYKPNAGFFLASGFDGAERLYSLIVYIHHVAPAVPVILDLKAGDIGNSMEQYVRFAFDVLGADALTANPYLGQEANRPLLDRADKGAIFLCKTSNKGSGEFQDLIGERSELMCEDGRQMRLYEQVATSISNGWNANGNCGLVVGATYPQQLARVRSLVPDLPLLIPGIGTQGGDVEATIQAGKSRMIINVGSAILYASSGRDFADAAAAVAGDYDAQFRALSHTNA